MNNEIKIDIVYWLGNKKIPVFEIPRLNGRKHGMSRHYHPDGKLRKEEFFIHGRLQGLRRLLLKGGEMFSHKTYDKGNQHGVALMYKY